MVSELERLGQIVAACDKQLTQVRKALRELERDEAALVEKRRQAQWIQSAIDSKREAGQ